MKPQSAFITALLALLLCNCALGQWIAPQLPTEQMEIPMLTQPIKLDGNLSEWSSAKSIPILTKSCVSIYPMFGTWNDPKDQGMEVYYGWTADGIFIAARVADNDIVNDQKSLRDFWRQDSVEIFFDGRTGKEFRSTTYTPGAFQILVRPPINGLPVAGGVNPKYGTINGVKVAGKRTHTGYNIEVFIPWSGLLNYKAHTGSQLGLQFSLNDYDGKRTKDNSRKQLGVHAQQYMAKDPSLFLRCKLGGNVSSKVIDSFQICMENTWFSKADTLNPAVVIGSSVAPNVGSVELAWKDVSGNTFFDKPAKIEHLAKPWDTVLRASAQCPSNIVPEGYSVLSAVIFDKNGSKLGELNQAIFYKGEIVTNALARFKKADVAGVSEKQPFKAAQYMGAAARIEVIKRTFEIEKPERAAWAIREFNARMDVLETGKVSDPNAGIYKLLELTANPNAQVIIEFPKNITRPLDLEQKAQIQFICGSIPYAYAFALEYPSEEAALAALTSARDNVEDTVITNLPARIFYGRGKVCEKIEAVSGNILITTYGPTREVAEMILALVAAGKPVTPSEADKLRHMVMNAVTPKCSPLVTPNGFDLYCGDEHMHTFYSDGWPSPVGQMFEAIYCGHDYDVITDHQTLDGATLATRLFSEFNVNHPIIAGQEITNQKICHANAYPLKKVIPWSISPSEMVRAAHAQGAVIVWNHPGDPKTVWQDAQVPKALQGTQFDAWEHIPKKYDAWKAEGILPPLIGSTDTHDGTFAWGKRTVILSPGTSGNDVAACTKAGRMVLIDARSKYLVYGPDDRLIATVCAAISDGTALKEAKALRLKNMLKNADLMGLFNASETRIVKLKSND